MLLLLSFDWGRQAAGLQHEAQHARAADCNPIQQLLQKPGLCPSLSATASFGAWCDAGMRFVAGVGF